MEIEIEKQVCSYTQAIELHDLGVKQKSLWYHTNSKKWGILIKSSIDFTGNPHSAFTCAELGEMLPKRTENTFINMNTGAKWYSFDYIEVRFVLKGDRFEYEAEARADLLIKLIKEGHIKVEDVNKRGNYILIYPKKVKNKTMKDNSELKYLTAYLPYRLKCKVKDSLPQLKDYEIAELHAVYSNAECVFHDLIESERGFHLVQPILHPLSDLITEIEVNGEKLTPINFFDIGDNDNENWIEFDHGNIKLIKTLKTISKHGLSHDINFLPFVVVQKLLEWHFDLYELIKNGRAVDINIFNQG